MEKLNSPLFIKSIIQEDNKHFSITWNDGKKSVYHLADLQYHCPCTKCRDREIREKEKSLSCHYIKNVGNYAIQILFTKGCSRGIYTYAYLRNFDSC
ncbi:MAG: hypothetical protein S4CHLAM37_02550 [Chlamydiia bacterium]|nr:hypothetical protein [Chlamydiia bacterium]